MEGRKIIFRDISDFLILPSAHRPPPRTSHRTYRHHIPHHKRTFSSLTKYLYHFVVINMIRQYLSIPLWLGIFQYRILPSIIPCSIIIPPPNLTKFQKFNENPIKIPWQIFDNLGADFRTHNSRCPILIMALSQNHQSFHAKHMVRPICHAKY